MKVKKTTLCDGQEVINLTHDDNEGDLAVVNLSVIGKLTELLPFTDLNMIKRGLKTRIDDSETLIEMVDMLSKEVKFHRTVNLIRSITTEELAPEVASGDDIDH